MAGMVWWREEPEFESPPPPTRSCRGGAMSNPDEAQPEGLPELSIAMELVAVVGVPELGCCWWAGLLDVVA